MYHATTMHDADRSPEQPESRKLIHLINNLLSVIQTQADVARLTATKDAYEQALGVIAASGEKALTEVAQIRRQSDQSSSRSASSG